MNARGNGARPVAWDAFREALARSQPPRMRAMQWTSPREDATRLTAESLERALDEGKTERLILSLSHDDYARHYGGVQLVIGDEQLTFNRNGWRYLHLSPAHPVPMLAEPSPAEVFPVQVRLDGVWMGVATFADLIDTVTARHAGGTVIQCVIHHLMGFMPELVLDLCRASGDPTPIIWIHDFFTLCPSYALMRNDVAYCGAPSPDSTACGICAYGDERRSHLTRIGALFAATRPRVIAPSEIARGLWHARGELPHSHSHALPIARLRMAPSELVHPAPDTPLRVAHLGARAFLKGWAIFEALAREFATDGRYHFFQLGTPNADTPCPDYIRNIPVIVDTQRRDAMIEAIAETRIDIVVSWQLWPETFSLSVHEALAGGAFVVTHAGAGNVWPAVESNAPDRGCALDDAQALFELFAGDSLQGRIADGPRQRGALIPVAVTPHWLRTHPRTLDRAASP